jgi:hypothetical protein
MVGFTSLTTAVVSDLRLDRPPVDIPCRDVPEIDLGEDFAYPIMSHRSSLARTDEGRRAALAYYIVAVKYGWRPAPLHLW